MSISLLSRVSVLLFAVALSVPVAAKTAAKDSEYKKADMNLYWRSDVVKSDPTILILQPTDLVHKGDSYFLAGHKKAPKEIYVQVTSDWIEPITPPSMPATLGVAPDAMQIREPQGDVQIALPSNPASFSPAQDGTNLPNGAVVKTGADGTAAVLFGGVNSARLIPNTEAGVSQMVTPTLRSTTIDLKSGGVFSKVGTRPGDPQKQDYEVHTFNGNAVAKGTDFFTLSLPARTDVWVAQGTVQMEQTDGKVMSEVTASETGPLEIMRLPVFEDPIQTMSANTESLSTTLNFIPTVNLKLKALHDQMTKGVKLTANEKAYLKRIKKVPALIKLALVEPPPAPVPPPVAAAPQPSLAEPDAEVPAKPVAEIPDSAKRYRPPPKLDTRPVPSPAPGASPNPLPPVETDATVAQPAASTPTTSANSETKPSDAAPAPRMGPTPTVSSPTATSATASTSTTGKPVAKHHKKPTVTTTAASTASSHDTSGNTAPISTGPNDTVP